MSSHWISRRQVKSDVIAGIIALIILALGIYAVVCSDELSLAELWSVAIFPVCGLILCVICLYHMLFTFRGGKYAIDEKGIAMHIGCRRWFLPWDEVQECDMWGMQSGGLGGLNVWVYFSTRHLEEGEPLLFFHKKWDHLEKVAFFQYSKKDLQKILDSIPSRFSRNLRAKQEELDSCLKWTEKVRHR